MKATLLFLLALALPAQKTHEFCAPCHAEQVADFQTHSHFKKDLSCDACHGASLRHRTSTGAAPPDRVAAPDEVPALCGACHAAEQKEYGASKHAALVLARARVKAPNCAACHGVHSLRPVERIVKGCQTCHATLSAAHPAMRASASCLSCHSKHTMKAQKASF